MEDIQTFIGEIEDYCRDNAIAESTFGRLTVNDGKFVSRLRAGRGVTMRTVDRVRKYMTKDQPAAPKGNGSETAAVPDNLPLKREAAPKDNGAEGRKKAKVYSRFIPNRRRSGCSTRAWATAPFSPG